MNESKWQMWRNIEHAIKRRLACRAIFFLLSFPMVRNRPGCSSSNVPNAQRGLNITLMLSRSKNCILRSPTSTSLIDFFMWKIHFHWIALSLQFLTFSTLTAVNTLGIPQSLILRPRWKRTHCPYGMITRTALTAKNGREALSISWVILKIEGRTVDSSLEQPLWWLLSSDNSIVPHLLLCVLFRRCW